MYNNGEAAGFTKKNGSYQACIQRGGGGGGGGEGKLQGGGLPCISNFCWKY